MSLKSLVNENVFDSKWTLESHTFRLKTVTRHISKASNCDKFTFSDQTWPADTLLRSMSFIPKTTFTVTPFSRWIWRGTLPVGTGTQPSNTACIGHLVPVLLPRTWGSRTRTCGPRSRTCGPRTRICGERTRTKLVVRGQGRTCGPRTRTCGPRSRTCKLIVVDKKDFPRGLHHLAHRATSRWGFPYVVILSAPRMRTALLLTSACLTNYYIIIIIIIIINVHRPRLDTPLCASEWSVVTCVVRGDVNTSTWWWTDLDVVWTDLVAEVNTDGLVVVIQL